MSHQTQSPTDRIEETLIALILGAMTVVTFANVVARYGFNSNILWAVEFTVFLFAWMVLLGASYAVKIGAHLGVDAILNLVSPSVRKVMGLVAVAVCIAFSLLLLKGSWDYWANFANLPGTEGRWFPTGFEDKFRGKAWYETDDIPMPAILNWMEGAFNDGDEYEKLPRLIPYMIMPISMALLVFRFIQAAFRLLRGDITMLIVSHEAEDAVDDAAQYVKENT
ncbi:TRAP transporter small permease [Amylibacter sp. IMCC11727]|uniref:TRAP transporter small permease n=1 Tax=Amylibacter sp. IMCC11727 TaxID=3039851 RepID=UPI00244DA2D7|nr:TRAP transporter small permease [Amylibacter sp. IMCC11727]WGI21739.1 TRAP transporter small permease [Amylibacter sp. IMCC11727]